MILVPRKLKMKNPFYSITAQVPRKSKSNFHEVPPPEHSSKPKNAKSMQCIERSLRQRTTNELIKIVDSGWAQVLFVFVKFCFLSHT